MRLLHLAPDNGQGTPRFFCPRGLTLPGDPTGDPITDDVWLNSNEVI